jgi:hypothetical protein
MQKNTRGLMQMVIGILQMSGAGLYLLLLSTSGWSESMNAVGGFLVLVTLAGLILPRVIR